MYEPATRRPEKSGSDDDRIGRGGGQARVGESPSPKAKAFFPRCMRRASAALQGRLRNEWQTMCLSRTGPRAGAKDRGRKHERTGKQTGSAGGPDDLFLFRRPESGFCPASGRGTRSDRRRFAAGRAWIVTILGWFFILGVNVWLGFLIYVAMSRHGHIRLGPRGSRPDTLIFRGARCCSPVASAPF